QPQYSPMSVEKQIAIIFCGTRNLLAKVPVNKINQFEEDFLTQLELKHKNILEGLRSGKLTDELTSELEAVAKEMAAKYAS
ncbi:MAG: F0F1 ATP synthase subunit alpha, partial [Bacteroidales bacterium]|nr:F0F1 ATP synthase subunit alpha [Bacteroidales bacterium]